MRRLVLGVAALAVLLPGAAAAWADGGEPVSLSVSTPAVVGSNVGFPVRVTVSSDRGLLTGSYRVRIRAAAECGASFDSTPGAVLLDEPLTGSGKLKGTAKTHSFGHFTACAFLEQQGDDRLFAFDDTATFAVTHGCTTYSRRVIATRRSLKNTRKRLRHAHGAHRAALSRRAAHLRAKLKRANARRRRACHA
jgi:hypothetical protein